MSLNNNISENKMSDNQSKDTQDEIHEENFEECIPQKPKAINFHISYNLLIFSGSHQSFGIKRDGKPIF